LDENRDIAGKPLVESGLTEMLMTNDVAPAVKISTKLAPGVGYNIRTTPSRRPI